jgi:hypothetical protein
MVESLKAVHRCDVVQMSDLKTPKVVGVDEVVRIPFRIPLMPYRIKHLASYPHDEMLIVDTDIIAKRPIDEVWDCSFDVALTKRALGDFGYGDDGELDMPYNTGVMLSRGTEFWGECFNWLAGQSADLQNWYGDQRAVCAVAQRGHYNVLPLTCAEFNWSPNSRDDSSDARFWHYKGGIRKKWMPGYMRPDIRKSLGNG